MAGGRFLHRVLAIYGLVFLAAVLWGALAGDANLLYHRGLGEAEIRWHDPLLGLAVGLAIVIASRLAERYFESFRRLGDSLASIVGRPSAGQIAALAAVSAIAEEALFRGAMQPTLGFALTSVIFGLLHVAPSLPYWAFTASALAGGLILGWEFEVTGNLVAPIVSHAVVNALNLHHIVNSRHTSAYAPGQSQELAPGKLEDGSEGPG